MSAPSVNVHSDSRQGDYGALSVRDNSPPAIWVNGKIWPSVETYLLWFTMAFGKRKAEGPISQGRSSGFSLYWADEKNKFFPILQKAQRDYERKRGFLLQQLEILELAKSEKINSVDEDDEELSQEEWKTIQKNLQSIDESITETMDALTRLKSTEPEPLSKSAMLKKWKKLSKSKEGREIKSKYEEPIYKIAQGRELYAQRELIQEWLMEAYKWLVDHDRAFRSLLVGTNKRKLFYIDPYAYTDKKDIAFFGLAQTSHESCAVLSSALRKTREEVLRRDLSHQKRTTDISLLHELETSHQAISFLRDLIRTQDISEFLGLTVSEILEAAYRNVCQIRVKKGKHRGISFKVYGVRDCEAELKSDKLRLILKDRGLGDTPDTDIEILSMAMNAPPFSEKALRHMFSSGGSFNEMVLALRADKKGLARRIRRTGLRDLYNHRQRKEKLDVVRCYLTWILEKKQEREATSKESTSVTGINRIVDRAIAKAYNNPGCIEKLINDVNKIYGFSEVRDDGSQFASIDHVRKDQFKEGDTLLSKYLDTCRREKAVGLSPVPKWAEVEAFISSGVEPFQETRKEQTTAETVTTSNLTGSDKETADALQVSQDLTPLEELSNLLRDDSDDKVTTALLSRIREQEISGQQGGSLNLARHLVEKYLEKEVSKKFAGQGLEVTNTLLKSAGEKQINLDQILRGVAGSDEEREASRNELILKKGLSDLLRTANSDGVDTTSRSGVVPSQSKVTTTTTHFLNTSALYLCSNTSSNYCKHITQMGTGVLSESAIPADTKFDPLLPSSPLTIKKDTTHGMFTGALLRTVPTLLHYIFLKLFFELQEPPVLSFFRLLNDEVQSQLLARGILVNMNMGHTNAPFARRLPHFKVLKSLAIKQIYLQKKLGGPPIGVDRDFPNIYRSWSFAPTPGIGTPALRQLLEKYGIDANVVSSEKEGAPSSWEVVFRDLLKIEGLARPWEELYAQYSQAKAMFRSEKTVEGLHDAHLSKFGLIAKTPPSNVDDVAISQLMSTFGISDPPPKIIYISPNRLLGGGNDGTGRNFVGNSLELIRTRLPEKYPKVYSKIVTRIQHIKKYLRILAGEDSIMSTLCQHPAISTNPRDRMRILTAMQLFLSDRLPEPTSLLNIDPVIIKATSNEISKLISQAPLNLTESGSSSDLDLGKLCRMSLNNYTRSLYAALDTPAVLDTPRNLSPNNPATSQAVDILEKYLTCVLSLTSGSDGLQQRPDYSLNHSEELRQLILQLIISDRYSGLLLSDKR